ncbi:MAG: flagellar type III secretion system pore protein FliP [Syntrophotalea acetylenica]|jgi:flagellar biosynthetic protein FliP|uniref:Flagellar biosynthetic protein FliP n=1 Tax=Syntrophotalea acetylenica TaxID=29542 RepID=A0A1L3GD48_SYNAC|nr:flagellar type III secretion system pore protein FliP [Syntrophotalea acetylenica]APG23769.1 flagellar biosynthetic protein FliP [Syntrophotalea acetylenica]APG44350.1 flagellar biosynthetic protein FliP [Syntrophotalea acetylenica]MDD4457068.1 flagellar type III secretion system pore protein FliP [Syntrophotalea acetylenica]MDY0261524.1 flagellar type III secretion system pore protein FliP [Syntrophotalea acetylenica]
MKHVALLTALLLSLAGAALADPLPAISIGIGQAGGQPPPSTLMQILLIMTVLSVAPAILLMTTAFVRLAIVLSFLRQAMGTQQMPPNQIIIGLALFLTFFIMAPVFNQINAQAVQPYLAQKIDQKQALNLAVGPMRRFMFAQTSEKELELLMEISGHPDPANQQEVPTLTLIPAFMLSELKRAFQIGFMVYIPFLVIDMIVASVLMSMGMMMLPPVIISLPFKLLLFVLVDGWTLIVGSLVQSFHML